MCDLIPKWTGNVLEPACGNGNFLVEIARRKHAAGMTPDEAASTIFGIDILQDNVVEARSEALGSPARNGGDFEAEYRLRGLFEAERNLVYGGGSEKPMKNLRELDEYRVKHPIWPQTDKSGAFKVYVNGRSFHVLASVDQIGDGVAWEHVSVTPKNQKWCPTWEEMSAIKDLFFFPDEEAVEFHPKHSEYVNQHEFCLHIWRPADGKLLRSPEDSRSGMETTRDPETPHLKKYGKSLGMCQWTPRLSALRSRSWASPPGQTGRNCGTGSTSATAKG